ncbi:MAG: hypothetical protein DCC72_11440, partial [Burkholderiales bacterium]
LPRRASDTSKGSFGSVLCYGGAPGMHGAVLLAARGAQAIGVGRIYVGTPQGSLFDAGQPQWMSAASDVGFGRFDSVAIGCGLGDSAEARAAVRRAIAEARALVVDADALNAIAADETLAEALEANAKSPAARGEESAANGGSPDARGATFRCIVTPHPLEAARLLRVDVPRIQSDRIGAACAPPARSPRSCAASRCSRAPAASSRRPRAAGLSSTPAPRRWPAPAPATCSPAPARPCSRAAWTPSAPPAWVRGCTARQARPGRASIARRTG